MKKPRLARLLRRIYRATKPSRQNLPVADAFTSVACTVPPDAAAVQAPKVNFCDFGHGSAPGRARGSAISGR